MNLSLIDPNWATGICPHKQLERISVFDFCKQIAFNSLPLLATRGSPQYPSSAKMASVLPRLGAKEKSIFCLMLGVPLSAGGRKDLRGSPQNYPSSTGPGLGDIPLFQLEKWKLKEQFDLRLKESPLFFAFQRPAHSNIHGGWRSRLKKKTIGKWLNTALWKVRGINPKHLPKQPPPP